jgi:ribosomal protein S18
MLLRSKFAKLRLNFLYCQFSTQAGKAESTQKSKDIRTKISNSAYLKYELTQNPEFDKAFPHLAKYKPQTTVPRESNEFDFIDSLTYHKRVPEEKTHEEILEENNKRFVEGYNTRKGPIQWMSKEAKEKVHQAVDARMRELEDTGLSREELLYDGKVGGIPLGLDPFFQFLKKNRLAREMLFKPAQEFTVERVIDMALRQDIGLDPALSRKEQNYLYKHQMDDETLFGLARNQVSDRKAFDPNAFYAEHHNEINMGNEILADPHRKYYKFPVTREQAKKATFRKIDVLDVHWRNTEFLAKFVGESGKIKNRFQNRLSKAQQRLIARTIRHARTLNMLPYEAYLKPTDKKSLRTIQEDVEDFLKKKINIETGQIYLDVPGENLHSEDPYQVQEPTSYDSQGYKQVKDLDFEFMPVMPNNDEVQILEAQHYAYKLKLDELKKKGVDVKKLKELRSEGLGKTGLFRPVDTEDEPDFSEENVKKYAQSFEQFKEKTRNIPVENFIEAYISEKALDFKYIKNASRGKQEGTQNNRSKEELLREIEDIKKELGVSF